jgi:YD repeat-containing protein
MNGSGFASLLLSSTDRYGSALTIQHDSAGNITQIVDPLGRATQLSYGQAGLVQMVQDPFGRKATVAYDAHESLGGRGAGSSAI